MLQKKKSNVSFSSLLAHPENAASELQIRAPSLFERRNCLKAPSRLEIGPMMLLRQNTHSKIIAQSVEKRKVMLPKEDADVMQCKKSRLSVKMLADDGNLRNGS